MLPPLLLGLVAAAMFVDNATQQCIASAQRWLGPSGTIVERLGRVPDKPWLDVREVTQRGAHREVIVPFIGIDERAEWADGLLMSVEDPFARIAEQRRPYAEPAGVLFEHRGATTRVVIDGERGPWLDDVISVVRAAEGRALVAGAVGHQVLVSLDGDVVDRIQGDPSGTLGVGFFQQGPRAYWNVSPQLTRIIDGHGVIASWPCDLVTGDHGLGPRGLLLDCIFHGFSFVVVDNDGNSAEHALNTSRPLNAWWVSADREHFMSATHRWVVVDGVRGPEAAFVWDVRIREGLWVKYLAVLARHGSVPIEIVEVTMPWPVDFCGEPFVEWRHGT